MTDVWIFGYGSLVSRAAGAPVRDRPCTLRDHRRRWNVAMDNRRTLPGYKVYVDPVTGEQPPCFVTFLNVEPKPGASVNGVAFPAPALDVLDARERNYVRRDVSGLLDVDLGGPVWAYFGLPAARERYETGREAGTAVISRAYRDRVERDFASFGAEMARAFAASTDAPEVPVRELRRVEVPVR